MSKLIQLHLMDNVLIAAEEIAAGIDFSIDLHVVQVSSIIPIGYKIAAKYIQMGEKIIKYGIAIGSATQDIKIGDIVHLHNMKSDYIATYTIDEYKKHGD